ncbi:MAG: hypothetical protein N2Z62_11775 [Rhodobacteraceae bacterium]|nr:hypothetical protein [Paracoccaceae bacterium]
MEQDPGTGHVPRLLKALGLSLLNATLLLFLLLVLSSIWLVERFHDLTQATAEAAAEVLGPDPAVRLAADIAALDAAVADLSALEARIAAWQAAGGDPAGIAALRQDMQALGGKVDALRASLAAMGTVGAGSARAVIAAIARDIAQIASEPAAGQGGADP